ncbi:MAG: dihydroorotate dehydrogenase [Bdellovibrionales bacterium GWA2_49_15]|nr:MAG: dihydroorotate dehydrogenase [Bdellovibrionales bacterium GWA2_49_15]HAZ12355.1 dihydroorotate dehydrogenase-like protein [Bdellovibrionales bacterium]
MKLETVYMGLKLKNPILAASCPMTKDLARVKEMEEAGVAGIVLPSLFEEEISYDQHAMDQFLSYSTHDVGPEATSFFPEPENFKNFEGEEYLESLRKIKSSVRIPVIGSLNGSTAGGWVKYAKLIQEAGADALELNIFYIPTELSITGTEVENRYIEILKSVKAQVSIPVAVKMAPFFSSLPSMAKRFDDAGANGLVLFNRFLEPDFDLDHLEAAMKPSFSTRSDIRLPLHWTAILYGKVKASLGATRGIKSGLDVLKMVMAGADATMISSLFYQEGVSSATRIIKEMTHWMEEHEYSSIEQMRGSMSYNHVTDKSAFVRANYMKMLRSI